MKEVLKRGMLKFENSFFFPCRPMCIGNDNPLFFERGGAAVPVVFRSPHTRCF